MAMEKWFEEGKKLPRPTRAQTEESAAEIRRVRESGERPALTDESSMSEMLERAEKTSARWNARLSI